MSIRFATQTGKFLCAALGSEMDMGTAAMVYSTEPQSGEGSPLDGGANKLTKTL